MCSDDASNRKPTRRDGRRPARGGIVRRGRRKLWDTPQRLHCPIVGTCLSTAELRRLAAKCGIDGRSMSDYELHLRFVSAADGKNGLSLAAHKLLEKKYRGTIARLAGIREREKLLDAWAAQVEQGEVAAALWALVTHPAAADAEFDRAYRDVHMLSHQVGAGEMVDRARLNALQASLDDFRQRYAENLRTSARTLERKEGRIQELQRQVARCDRIQERYECLTERLADLESGQEQSRLRERNERLERALEAAESERRTALDRAATAESRRAELERRLAAVEARLAAARSDHAALERLIAPDCGMYDGDCPGYPDLCGKRVLCVGGRGSLVGHYRLLVDRCNGEFLRHDGGLEDNPNRLGAMLAAADVVICPADNVSHDAYNRTKRFCKQHRKTCLLLDRSGVSAFASALERLAGPAGLSLDRPAAHQPSL